MMNLPKSKEMVAKYQMVFGTPMGLEVLEDMGIDCGFGEMIECDHQQVAMRNYFEMLLSIVRGGNGRQQQSYIPAVARMPIHDRVQEPESNE
jgi:hypothetical protein